MEALDYRAATARDVVERLESLKFSVSELVHVYDLAASAQLQGVDRLPLEFLVVNVEQVDRLLAECAPLDDVLTAVTNLEGSLAAMTKGVPPSGKH